jgi:unsaturated rhamnogalacturonyl hydrolase
MKCFNNLSILAIEYAIKNTVPRIICCHGQVNSCHELSPDCKMINGIPGMVASIYLLFELSIFELITNSYTMKIFMPFLLTIIFSAFTDPKPVKNIGVDGSPKDIGRLITADLLARSEFMIYTTEQVKAIHYAEACAGFGAARLAGLLNDRETLQKLAERYTRVIDDSIINTANHVDANVYGILPLELYMHNKEEKFFKQGIELADEQWENPLPDGLTNQTRYWIDDVWMIGSLQVQAYRATGKIIYLERAALEIDAYIKKLQQPNGLFYHGINAPFFWGRGNGWVAAGLAELLSELPDNNPHYTSILEGYRKMMKTLVENQAEDGMWRQLIDKEESFKETSSTAMFGYAMTVGVKKGLLTEERYKEASQKAWKGLTGYINEDGKVRDVCAGTGQSTDVNFYLTRPRITGDLHGQAPLLWFAYSLLAGY